jgi:hypothetical protein
MDRAAQETLVKVAAEWCTEEEIVFKLILCVKWSSETAKEAGLAKMAYSVENNNALNYGLESLGIHYYCYRDGSPVQISTQAIVRVTQDDSYTESGDLTSIGPLTEPNDHPVKKQQVFTTQGEVITGRTFESEDKACMTPNQMYEIFNIEDPTIDPASNVSKYPWFLQTHSNGGFSLKINRDFDNFKISKDFCDSLGLVPEFIRNRARQKSMLPDTDITIIVVRTGEPYDDEGHADVVWSGQDFTEQIEEEQISHFTLWNGQLIDSEYCRNHIGATLRSVGIVPAHLSYYRLIAVSSTNAVTRRVNEKVKRAGQVLTDPEDGEYYFWSNVQPGDLLLNSNVISVESFSLFEGIQIVCPSLPFSPMITSYSSGMRVLCEIRLSYEYTGNSDQSGRVISTADAFVGDIVWNANNFQYLQLQSVGKIYNLETRVQLVYRDCNRLPPKPVFIPPRGIFQCKVRLLAVK